MPVFQYSAINDSGQVIQGSYEGKDKNEILHMLREKSYYPVQVKDIAQGKKIKGLNIFGWTGIKHLAVFCRQFYTMLNAGITIVKCLDILAQQTENQNLRTAVGQLYESVQKGSMLSEAMREHKDIFPEILISMVEAGELSGTLDDVMERMAVHFEKEHKIRTKIMSASIYPIILIIAIVGVLTFLLTVVMPTFISMFESSNVPLPLPTRIILGMSKVLRGYWYIILVVVIFIIYAAIRFVKSDTGRYAFDRFKLRMPIIKGTVKKIVTSRFTRTLSVMLSSGIPLMQAMDATARVVGNRLVSDGILNVKEDLRRGSNLSLPIKRMGVFPPMVDSMVKIGEESGNLDDLLGKTADYYDDEVEVALQRMVAILEPLLIVIMGFVVGFIVISIALPLFDMFKVIDQQ